MTALACSAWPTLQPTHPYAAHGHAFEGMLTQRCSSALNVGTRSSTYLSHSRACRNAASVLGASLRITSTVRGLLSQCRLIAVA